VVGKNVLGSLDDLNFFARRFTPRIQLRVSSDAVIAATPETEVRVAASISFTRTGEILGIGGESADAADATTLHLFTASAAASPQYDDLLDKFLRLLLRRVHRKAAWLRPVLIVEGLDSFGPDIRPRVRESLVRALTSAGAAAIVVEPAAQ
jgi:hypothetical protein